VRDLATRSAEETTAMKFMVTFAWQPDAEKRAEGIARFRKLGNQAPAGAKLIGRLTRADLSGGFVLLESEDPKSLAEFAYTWSDLMELSIVPVLEDEGLAHVFASAEKPKSAVAGAR
jgi:hypothetical protein